MNEKAFTLLEVMIAMFIFSIVVGGMAPVFTAHLQRNAAAETRTEAMQAGQYVLDQLRISDPSTLDTTGTRDAEEIVVNGRTYEVFVSFCMDAGYCPGSNTRQIGIEVKRDHQTLFRTKTVYTLLR